MKISCVLAALVAIVVAAFLPSIAEAKKDTDDSVVRERFETILHGASFSHDELTKEEEQFFNIAWIEAYFKVMEEIGGGSDTITIVDIQMDQNQNELVHVDDQGHLRGLGRKKKLKTRSQPRKGRGYYYYDIRTIIDYYCRLCPDDRRMLSSAPSLPPSKSALVVETPDGLHVLATALLGILQTGPYEVFHDIRSCHIELVQE